jgi:hypothetical protein
MSVKRTFIGMVEAGEPLIQQALEVFDKPTMRRHLVCQTMRYSVFAYWRTRCTKLSATFSS